MKRIIITLLVGFYSQGWGQVNPCAIPAAPPKAFTAGSTLVFKGDSNVVYTTAPVAAPGYNWYYTGTGVSLSMTGNTAKLHFSTSATSGNLVLQTHNYCLLGGTLSLPITVLSRNPCIADLHLTQADTIASGINYRRAVERIDANNKIINSGTQAFYSAGKSIELANGFQVNKGALFLAEIKLEACNEVIPIYLQKQLEQANGQWPTHASVPLPDGYLLTKNDLNKLVFLEDGRLIRSQIECVSTWRSGSPKWIHIYFSGRYKNLLPAKYELLKTTTGGMVIDSSLSVKINNQRINRPDTLAANEKVVVDNGFVRFEVKQAFDGLSTVWFDSTGQGNYTAPIVQNTSTAGPFLKQGGVEWLAATDSTEKRVVQIEQVGLAQITIKIEGWYKATLSSEKKYRYVTRITAYAKSPMIKIAHATIFAKDMRNPANAITELGFRIPIINGQTYRFGVDDETLNGDFVAGQPIYMHQEKHDSLRIIQDSTVMVKRKGRSSGWFSIAGNQQQKVSLMVNDIWQKFPKEVEMSSQNLTLYAWPKHGHDATFTPAQQLSPNEIYKFLCFHQGDSLQLKIPQKYIDTLTAIGESNLEGQLQHAKDADAVGVAIYNEFALLFSGSSASTEAWTKLYQKKPIALPDQKWIADSKAMGSIAERVQGEFDEIEEAIIDAPLSYSNPARNNNYGMFNFGDSNSEWKTSENRPNLHRVWFNNHYQFLFSTWQLFAARYTPDNSKITDLLQRVRSMTDHYSSIDLVRHGFKAQNGGDRPAGSFRHTKGIVHWGNQEEASLYKHWSDPEGIQMAWLIDANRWAKDGFEDWYKGFKNNDFGNSTYSDIDARNINTTVLNAIVADDYQSDPMAKIAIDNMADKCLKNPTAFMGFRSFKDPNGPLWHPLWVNRFYEFSRDTSYRTSIIQNAKLRDSKINFGLALTSLAFDLTGDTSILKRHFYFLKNFPRNLNKEPGTEYDNFGMGPGPMGDNHVPMQWMHYLKRLRTAGITQIPDVAEYGCYPGTSAGYVYVYNPTNLPLRFNVDCEQADNPFTSNITVYDAQKLLTNASDLESTKVNVASLNPTPVTTILRPLSYRRTSHREHNVDSLKNTLSPTLQATLQLPLLALYTSTGVGVYQGINTPDIPEAFAFRNRTTDPNATYLTPYSIGYLMPLVSDTVQLTIRSRSGGTSEIAIVKVTVRDTDGNFILNEKNLFFPRTPGEVVVPLVSTKAPYYINVYYSYSSAKVETSNCVEMTARSVSSARYQQVLLFGKDKAHVQTLKAQIAP